MKLNGFKISPLISCCPLSLTNEEFEEIAEWDKNIIFAFLVFFKTLRGYIKKQKLICDKNATVYWRILPEFCLIESDLNKNIVIGYGFYLRFLISNKVKVIPNYKKINLDKLRWPINA